MLTLFSLYLFVYSCISSEIATEINTNCTTTPCIIPLDPSIIHNVSEKINITNISISNTPITITSNSIEPARIAVSESLMLSNYASTITFKNVIIDGSSSNTLESFLQIDTNKPMQINIINSQILNFNTSLGVISITENIESFLVSNVSSTIYVDYTDISDQYITINFTNSQFKHNTNYKTNGGVLSLTGHEFQIYINQCNFTYNTATAWRKNGGCISWDRSAIPEQLYRKIDDLTETIKDESGEDAIVIYRDYNWSNIAVPTTYNSFIEITYSKFYNNYGSDAGGVLYIHQTKQYTDGFYDIESIIYTSPTMQPTNLPSLNTSEPSMNPTVSPTMSASIEIIRTFELWSEYNIYSGNIAGQYGGVFRHNGYMEKQEDEFSEIDLICKDINYNINIINDRFYNNGIPEINGTSQSYAFGGTLSITCAQVNVKSSLFKDNYAKYGSAMSIYASSNVEINDCDFEYNNATFGTVYINGLLNSNATEKMNDNYFAYIYDSRFNDNRAESAGAGVFCVIIDLMIIEKCIFRNNWNKFYGSVTADYFATYYEMNVEIIDSEFTNNSVISNDIGVGGAAITGQRFDFNDGEYILNCYNENEKKFSDNIKGLNLYINRCIFAGNSKSAIGLSVVSAFINNSQFINNSNSISNGGAIESKYSWFKIINSNFTNNNAAATGGAISDFIYGTYNGIYPAWSLPNITTIANNDNQQCEIWIESNIFTNNYVINDGLGGAIYIGVNCVIINNKFIANNGGYGGAISVNAYRMFIENNEFFGNNANIHGGCLFQTQYSNDFTREYINQNDSTAQMMKITQNLFSKCRTKKIGGGVFLRTSRNEEIEIHDNNFTQCSADDIGGGFVIGQLLGIAELNYGTNKSNGIQFTNITDSNQFTNNTGVNGFNDFISNPYRMYILSENNNPNYTVSPGISTSAALGAYDIFGQDFLSFMITDWRDREYNFEFFLTYIEYPPFNLLTVNRGSLSSGQANISFVISKGNETDFAQIILANNELSLTNGELQRTWQLVECPSGYGYNTVNKTCNLCRRNTFKVKNGWTICNPCLNGLSCRGGEHVQILHQNWWSAEFSDTNLVQQTFFCRLGQCCMTKQGCPPNSDQRCPNDRNPDSIGCGECKNGWSAMHGSHICSNKCSSSSSFNSGAIAAFILWPVILVFLFGLSKYDGDKYDGQGNICCEFYSISIIEITIIVLMDYYQSLPAILTFIPDHGTYFLINLFFARIPIGISGLCLFQNMTILQSIYWDLLIPSIILILSMSIFIFSHLYNIKLQRNDLKQEHTKGYQRLNIFFLEINGWFIGWVYDPLRAIMFALFFCIIPMLWSCSKLFKCIQYGNFQRFWNASGQECQNQIVIGFVFLFIFLTAIYVISNIYYSASHLVHHQDISDNKKLIPLYLQRVQPFYFMVYPFKDKNTRRHSKIQNHDEKSIQQSLTWQNIEFRKKKHFKYLYVGWCSPFIRKISCLLIYNCITGEKGQSDQTFIVTNLILITLVTYQLFSQDYTSMENYTLHLYCMYLLYWLVLLIVAGSTKIISENYDTMTSLRYIVNCIIYIPFITAVCSIAYAVALIIKPQLLERAKQPKTKEEQEYENKLTLNKNFMSQRSLMSSANTHDDDDMKQKSDNDNDDEKEDCL